MPFSDVKWGFVVLIVSPSALIKYFNQDVVREDTDRCRVSTPFCWGPGSVFTTVSGTILKGVRRTSKFSHKMLTPLSGQQKVSPEDESLGERRLPGYAVSTGPED